MKNTSLAQASLPQSSADSTSLPSAIPFIQKHGVDGGRCLSGLSKRTQRFKWLKIQTVSDHPNTTFLFQPTTGVWWCHLNQMATSSPKSYSISSVLSSEQLETRRQAGEVLQWVECLHCKNEDLSSIPRSHIQKLRVVIYNYNARIVETGRAPGLTGWTL